MKKYRVLQRLGAALVCLLVLNTVLAGFPPYPLAAAAGTAEQSSPVLEEATASDVTDDINSDDMVSDDFVSDDIISYDIISYDIISDGIILDEDEGMDPESATPSVATPSGTATEIRFVDVPDLVALDAGEADEDTWQKVLPQEAVAKAETGTELSCGLKWSLPRVNWDQPGLYLARIELSPPDGYVLGECDESYDVVISIHPAGMLQVIEVFAPMRYGMKGHTWTFAMKAGQDMAPLVEALEGVDTYSGILDGTKDSIFFSAEWDFSSVHPNQPGIYPVYRSLSLRENSLPDGVRAEDIFLPDYWRDLPVLFSVEEPGGPQLYGVLESPFDFIGSYAKLTEEELETLEVWYSIDGGGWILQTDEDLMFPEERVYYISKAAMVEGCSYSFRLKLGDHVSRELTVQKGEEVSPIWFTICMTAGNRDGTIEVEFPDVSQPPPPPDPTEESPESPSVDPTEDPSESPSVDPTEEGTSPPPAETTEGETEPPGVTDPSREDPVPPTRPSSDQSDSGGSSRPDSGSSGTHGMAGPGVTSVAESTDSPQNLIDPGLVVPGPAVSDPAALESPANRSTEQAGPQPGSGDFPAGEAIAAARQESGVAAVFSPDTETKQETVGTDGGLNIETEGSLDSQLMPEEVVTRWTTQISGKRVRKLLQMYPDWILFQKEEVSVLLSSRWLDSQQMKDSDVLTVSVSPGMDPAVTILINQKEPQVPPEFRVMVEEKERAWPDGMAAPVILFLVLTGVLAVFVRNRRWRH